MNVSLKHPKIEAIALDLDGTVRSSGGAVSADLLAQLASLRRVGVKVILVTGRALLDLRPLIDLSVFDVVVVENGAILVLDDERRSLAPAGWDAKRRVLLQSFPSTGHEEVIVALRREVEPQVRRLLVVGGEDVRVEFNKESLMLLPFNVGKGPGLLAALETVGVPPRNAMAIGDGENDLSMLRVAGLKVAVKNAVPELKHEADYVTTEDDGRGVSEAITMFCGAMS